MDKIFLRKKIIFKFVQEKQTVKRKQKLVMKQNRLIKKQ